jgi:G:T/U-mismatch repair DNA glycosylase
MSELTDIQIETHPLPPFLPPNAKLLMLGTFPPPLNRWAMDFYYPNFQNDMWRIFGLAFFDDKNHFMATDSKKFDRLSLEKFLRNKGIALSDIAVKVRRLKGNASDQFLEIVEKTNLVAMLEKITDCRAIMTAGEKAASTLLSITGSALPPVGGFVEFDYCGRHLKHYRMPSSSRAYPKPLSEKAEVYRKMFVELSFINSDS